MTHRERVIDTLRCRTTDRAPLMSWLGFTPWPEIVRRWLSESGPKDDAALDARLGLEAPFTSTRRYVECGPWTHFEERIIRDGPETHVQAADEGHPVLTAPAEARLDAHAPRAEKQARDVRAKLLAVHIPPT